jgi:apolipoprotein N-acyltransferase
VSASGQVHEATGFNTRAVVVRDMHLGGSRTLATRLGYWPEAAATGLALAALVCAVPFRRRRKQGIHPPELVTEAR